MARRRRSKSVNPFLRAMLPPAPRKRSKTRARPAVARPKTRTGSAHRVDPKTLLKGAGRWRSLRYVGPAGTRAYRVYLPKGLRRTTKAPLLLALHGCHQDPEAFAASTRLDQLADTHQFVLVLPQQSMSGNANRCWNWYRPEHQSASGGEPAILAAIVEKVSAETRDWRIDPDRVYAVGMSAGAAMTMTIAATHPDLFAAIGVHSGPPYRSASTPGQALSAMGGHGTLPPPASGLPPLPPLVVFQGDRDAVVASANGERMVQQWLAAYAAATGSLDTLRPQPPVVRAASASRTGPRGSRMIRWLGPGRRRVVEWWQVDGLGHAWSGGVGALPFSDARGPRASTAIWRFLAAHTRSG
jgi:poly(hydroxyalkanoate) depolymerase family esterase